MRNITGRDGTIIAEALATALAALKRLPDEYRPQSNMWDMERLLAQQAWDRKLLKHYTDEAEQRIAMLTAPNNVVA
jgi:hypothetical protein